MLHVGQGQDIIKQQLTRALGGDARNAFVGAVHNDFFEFADFRIDVDAAVGVHRLVFSSRAKVDAPLTDTLPLRENFFRISFGWLNKTGILLKRKIEFHKWPILSTYEAHNQRKTDYSPRKLLYYENGNFPTCNTKML